MPEVISGTCLKSLTRYGTSFVPIPDWTPVDLRMKIFATEHHCEAEKIANSISCRFMWCDPHTTGQRGTIEVYDDVPIKYLRGVSFIEPRVHPVHMFSRGGGRPAVGYRVEGTRLIWEDL
jgi:hypothetical protein